MKTLALRAAALVLSVLSLSPAAAEPFPNGPVTIVVSVAQGEEADKLARILAAELARAWSQPVTVDNVTGEGGAAAAWRVARSTWSAHTLLLASTAVIDNPKTNYFSPVALVSTSSLVLLAGPKSRIADVAGLLRLAKAKPGALSYGAVGETGAKGLAGERFKSVAGVDLRRVPHATSREAIASVLAGKVDVAFVPVKDAAPQVVAGALRALAVTGVERASALPKVPTVAEAGLPGCEAVGWYGLMLPTVTPLPFIALHNADVGKVLALPDVRTQIQALGLEPAGGPVGRLADLWQRDREQWSMLAKPKSSPP